MTILPKATLRDRIEIIVADAIGDEVNFPDTINDLLTLFRQQMLGIIGEDEHTKPVRGIEAAFEQLPDALNRSIKNKLKAQLRQEVEKL